MALTKEALSPDSQSDFEYRPLALSPWDMAFNSNGELIDKSQNDTIETSRTNSYGLAFRTVEQAIQNMKNHVPFAIDDELPKVASSALLSIITDQASRNDRYNSPETRERLAEQYPENYEQIIYGTASHGQLARTVLDNDQQITSLEVARHTHAAEWEYGHNVNEDVRSELLRNSALQAVPLYEEPRFKIKGFYDRAILGERKRNIMEFMGGKALLVMRLNFLLDTGADDMPTTIKRHINREREKQESREHGNYDFTAENQLLLERLDDDYIRRPLSHEKPNFIVPLQTGYYVYSPEAHEREKQQEQAEEQRKKARVPLVKQYWAQFGSES